MTMKALLKRTTALLMAALMFCGALTGAAAANARTNFDMRKKVVGLAGIMNVSTGMNEPVTRAEFARMCVLGSSYRDILTTSSNISVFADVLNNNEYAAVIRICAENGWMSGYLGGLFKPDQAVTLNEAARAMLGMLGYTSSDFSGDEYNRRLAMFSSLEMNENITKQPTEALTKEDVVNLFYNLMRCDMKNGSAYATVLDATLSDDGEVNAMSMADKSLKGPKYVTKTGDLDSYLPFPGRSGSTFINGEASSWDALTSIISGGVVVYYSATAKTIWAYAGDSGNSSKGVYRGKVESIVYQSSSTLTPSAVVVDGTEYAISSSDMQFAFSIYGSVKVGETIVVIYNKSSGSLDDDTYTIIDYTY